MSDSQCELVCLTCKKAIYRLVRVPTGQGGVYQNEKQPTDTPCPSFNDDCRLVRSDELTLHL